MKLGPKQKKWIKALKSGKYKQCKRQLCNGVGYCCLGVANEVLDLNEVSLTCLPGSFKSIGLRSGFGHFSEQYQFPRGSHTYSDLADLNDNGIPFRKIAEFIENNPELVFTRSV